MHLLKKMFCLVFENSASCFKSAHFTSEFRVIEVCLVDPNGMLYYP